MKFYFTVFALLISLLFFGCAKDNRQKIVVYSPHGKDLLSKYEKAFEETHPNADVQAIDAGSQAILDRVRTEKNNPQASIWWGAPNTIFQTAADEGLLAAYRPTWANAINADAKDAQDRWYGTFLTPEGIAYNTNAIKTPPQSWDDLLKPEYKGRVLVRAPLESGTMQAIFAAMILRQPNEDAGFAWLKKLDAQTKTYTADPTQLYLKLARGEGDLTLWDMPDIALQKKKGNPFAIVFPPNETPVVVDGIALIKGGKNEALAQQFYEFVTSQDAMIEQANELFRIPARTDIAPEKLPSWIKETPILPMKMDWKRVHEKSKAWMKRWDETVKSVK